MDFLDIVNTKTWIKSKFFKPHLHGFYVFTRIFYGHVSTRPHIFHNSHKPKSIFIQVFPSFFHKILWTTLNNTPLRQAIAPFDSTSPCTSCSSEGTLQGMQTHFRTYHSPYLCILALYSSLLSCHQMF